LISPSLFGIIAGVTVLLLIVSYFAARKAKDKPSPASQPILYIPPAAIHIRPPSNKLPNAKVRDYGIQSLAREIAASGKVSPENREKEKSALAAADSKAAQAEPRIHPLLSDSRAFAPDAVFAASVAPAVVPTNDAPVADPIAQALEAQCLPSENIAQNTEADAAGSPVLLEPEATESSLFLNSNGIIINYDAIWQATNHPSQRARVENVESVVEPHAMPPSISLESEIVDSPAADPVANPVYEDHAEAVNVTPLDEAAHVTEGLDFGQSVHVEAILPEFFIPESNEIENFDQPGYGADSDVEPPLTVDSRLGQENSELSIQTGQPPSVAEFSGNATTSGFLKFYGLGQQPFDVTPDPGYLYLSRVHREALLSISQGLENFRGFMALVAEPGLGKTTVLHKIMEEFRDSSRIVFLFQTQCTSSELLRYLLSEMGVEYAGTDVVSMHKKLNDVLFQEMLQGRRFVLIVDEAQNLDDSVLETIRLLSNFETTHSKLIQIILAGQPELLDTLVRPCLSQLRQRISILTRLEPLGVSETAEYVQHRLRAARYRGPLMFTPEAMEAIAERSGGVPRCINNICFNALMAGYELQKQVIDSEIVRKVAADLDIALLMKRTQRNVPGDPTTSVEAANGHDFSVNDSQANGSSENGSSKLARLLIEALAGSGKKSDSEIHSNTRKGFALTGKLTEKLTSQSWGKKNEFRIQVSLEREYSPSLPIADHYYCRSFYVSEDQAVHLREGKQVRIKFEQD